MGEVKLGGILVPILRHSPIHLYPAQLDRCGRCGGALRLPPLRRNGQVGTSPASAAATLSLLGPLGSALVVMMVVGMGMVAVVVGGGTGYLPDVSMHLAFLRHTHIG